MTSLQEVYVSVKGIIADNLESMGVEASSSDGLTTLAGKILDIEPSVSGLDLDTALTLSASSSTVTVNDSITLTATLTASYDDETLVNVDLSGVLQNATIKFYEGSTLKGTATTNSSGVATYIYTPTTGGSKTLKAVFDGTENFQDAESTGVSITVNKIQSYISLLSSANSIVAGTALTLYGVLMDDDNEYIPNASVKLYNGNTLLDTLTTDSVGAYTTTLSNLTVGSYSFKTTYEGSDVYQNVTSSTKSITVTAAPEPDSISLTSNKSILSYADSESATLTATVLDDNNNPLEGETVTFYNGSTSMGTATTNSSGVATKSYSSSGAGDVSFTAQVRSLVSETYELEDCYYFDPQTTNKNRYTVTSGGANISYSSDGVTITGTQATDSLVKNTALTLPNSYSAEVTLTKLSGYTAGGQTQYGGLCFDNCLIDMHSGQINIYTLSPIALLTTINQGVSQGDVLKIEMDNGTMKIYINDVLKTTQSITHTGIHQHRTYKPSNQNVGKSITAKDLKVKPL